MLVRSERLRGAPNRVGTAPLGPEGSRNPPSRPVHAAKRRAPAARLAAVSREASGGIPVLESALLRCHFSPASKV